MSGAGDDPGAEGEVVGGCLPGLERLNSIMVTSSPRDMAEALAEDNFRLFADLLQRHKDSTIAGMVNGADGKATTSSVNDNIVQGDHGHSALIHLVAESGKTQYLREMLKVYPRQVNVDLPHQVSSQRPIHLAAEGGHFKMARLLLESSAKVDSRGSGASTALHIASNRSGVNWLGAQDKDIQQRGAKRAEFVRVARELVRWGANPDARDTLGYTPLYYAAGPTGSIEMTRALLQTRACVSYQIEVEDEETLDTVNMSLEEYIRTNKPGALDGLDLRANQVDRNSAEDQLFQVLYAEAYEPGAFKKKWAEVGDNNNMPINPDADNGTYTFLQYCCDQGNAELVKFLLDDCGADPNRFCVSNPFPPLVLAAYHGYYRVLEAFKTSRVVVPVSFTARTKVKKENVFHQILKGESKAYLNVKYRDYQRCMDVLLDVKIKERVQGAINAQDYLGNSPLHVAAALHNIPAIKALLRREANIGLKNRLGETAIGLIPSEVMKEFLDECLESEGLPSDRNFRITFKYSFLGPPMSNGSGSTSRATGGEDVDQQDHDYSRNSHRLIPVQTTSSGDNQDNNHHFNDCDDVTVIADDCFQDLPEAEPLWYMSQLPEHRKLLTHPIISSFLGLKWARIQRYYYYNLAFYLTFVAFLTAFLIKMNIDLDDPGAASQSATQGWGGLSVVTLVLLITMALREIFQALVSFRRYVFSLENLLEVAMIVSSFYLILAAGSPVSNVRKPLSSAVILMAWTEMVLMFGRHPALSTYIAMLARVSVNFVKVLAWYFSIIVAFALAFFVILKRPEASAEVKDAEQDNEHFADPGISLMKTIVMSLTGEIEYEGIKMEGPGNFKLFSQIVFVLWVFFVMLVLNNLLNGLAVQDIGEIQRDCEVVSAASQVELVAFIESMLLGDPFQFLTNWPQYWCWDRQRIPRCDCLGRLYRQRWIRNILNVVVGPTLLLNNSKGALVGKKAVFMPNIPQFSNREVGRYANKDLPEAFEDDSMSNVGEGDKMSDQMALETSILEAAKILAVEKQAASNNADGSECGGGVSLEDIQARMKKIEKGLVLLSKQQNFIIEKLNLNTATDSSS